MTEVYKIVYKFIINGKSCWRTLFHGINYSTFQPYDEWVIAEKKMVKDGSGGREYLSGIHCFRCLNIALNYIEKFRDKDDKIVVKCLAKGLRQKPTNPDVWLADEIFVPSQK